MPDRSADYQRLRNLHPRLVFEHFQLRSESEVIWCQFRFVLEPDLVFQPTLTIQRPALSACPEADWPVLFFHIGLIELLSYWKAACPPQILIRAGKLSPEQVAWWREVYFHGLGEFFYTNGIQASVEDFVRIEAEGPEYSAIGQGFRRENLIPVGGGKDSLVTLDLHRHQSEANRLFFLNPTKAQWETAAVMGYPRERIIVAERKLDAGLLELNRRNYLNGHTPFSALLAFIAVTAAALHGPGRVLLSNERSADESTIPGTLINHQWSKSWMFEKMFHDYVQDWLIHRMAYASVLRPWNELQIAQQFALERNKPGWRIFRSCNVGQKTDSWCAECPKCLFVNIILSPFLTRPELREVFAGREPLDNARLQHHFTQLIGADESKPFECIGTIDEVRAALSMTARLPNPPELVRQFEDQYPSWMLTSEEVTRLLKRFLIRPLRTSFFDDED